MIKKKYQTKTLLALLTLAVIVLIGSFGYGTIQNNKNLEKLSENHAHTIDAMTKRIEDIETILLATQEENTTLAQALADARKKTDSLADQFEDIDDTVDDLERLSNTDPELLKKYSKVFFLNENYAPTDLKTIPEKYTYNPQRSYQIHGEVWPYLKDLMDDARDDDIDIQVISAFRSFGDQTILKGAYTVTYGAGSANQFSADQGYSEHQLGTAVDFTNDTVGATFSGFAASETYEWLLKNAHKYGFTLSYPEGNQFYVFEPWHWRFVGERLAKKLHDREQNFYDWNQRDIDEYLIDLFD